MKVPKRVFAVLSVPMQVGVVRSAIIGEYPALRALLGTISERLTDRLMQELNCRGDLD
ncbi:hypothetical protein [Nocardia bhagyanarayanae]|uniref:hypothetical protein n=1 Tax=Nocardia bhagyanarayanae TaxID=1215925 RepID=UPI00163AE914